MQERHETGAATGSLVEWMLERELLRGPFLFLDYWASTMGLRSMVRAAHVRRGLVDPDLFRAGVDRPDLEVPRSRYYLALFFLGPILLPFRAFRRLGHRYRLRFRRELGEAVLSALEPFRLRLEPAGSGRVHVRADGGGPCAGADTSGVNADASGGDGVMLGADVLDPRVIAGFTSLFYPTYKLPLASLTAILATAILLPLLSTVGVLELVLRFWIPVGFPLLAIVLHLVYRDLLVALLGALPILFGRYLLDVLHPSTVESWWPFLGSLGALFLLYVLADWFFMPRPVPPVLLFYSSEAPARPYEREADAPWWLEGRAYWVWRYLMLTPAELNKFWERDWERVELWIRADGEAAGALEWVVTDAHYRELWIPYERIAEGERGARHRADALRGARERRPGLWLAEVDAGLVFHTPFVRAVSFVPEGGDVPVLGLRHLARALWKRGPRDRVESSLRALDVAKVRSGVAVLEDIPEAVAHLAARHMLSQPWTYWRYPLGAQRRREPRLYDREPWGEPPAAADPALQVKAPGQERATAPSGTEGVTGITGAGGASPFPENTIEQEE